MSVNTIDVESARRELTGPVTGLLESVRSLCLEGAAQEEIDLKISEAAKRVLNSARLLAHGRRVDIPIEVVHGSTFLRPPLLLSMQSPDGVLLGDLLGQLVTELQEEAVGRLPSDWARCENLALTRLEEALIWHQRAQVLRGTAEFTVTDPKRVG